MREVERPSIAPAAALIAIAAGIALRLIWPGVIEFKADERWTFEQVQAILGGGTWPAFGMPTSMGPANPGLSIWLFALLGFVFGADDPPALARAVQIVDSAALIAMWAVIRRVVPSDDREPWYWALALYAVNPFAVLLERKIWPPSLVPPFCCSCSAGGGASAPGARPCGAPPVWRPRSSISPPACFPPSSRWRRRGATEGVCHGAAGSSAARSPACRCCPGCSRWRPHSLTARAAAGGGACRTPRILRAGRPSRSASASTTRSARACPPSSRRPGWPDYRSTGCWRSMPRLLLPASRSLRARWPRGGAARSAGVPSATAAAATHR